MDKTSLSQLPPPPKGQTGVTLEDLQGLPPPPQDQQGMTLDQIQGQLGTLPKPTAQSSFMQDVSSSIQNRGQNAYNAITSTEGNSNNPLVQGIADISHGVGATGQAFSAVTDIAGAFINHLIPQTVKDNFQKQQQDAQNNPLVKGISTVGSRAYDELGIRLNDFITKHPEVGKVLESALRTGEGTGNISNAILTAEGTAKSAQKTYDTAKNFVQNTTPGDISTGANKMVQNVRDKFTPQGENDLQKINQMITPKPTVKEARLAETQGRLFKGKSPTFFKEGGPDMIATPEAQANAARTIQKNIPNAANMSETDLYSSLDEKIGEKAQALKPEMQKVPITEDTVQKITDDWNTLKKAQKADAYLPNDVNLNKLQADFEQRLMKSGNKTMDDLWNTAKAYDASVPENVKKATDLSSESLQYKKDIWLQNRRILKSAINDTGTGLGKTSQDAFKEMTDMYNAQNNLLSKAKVETANAPSKFSVIKKTIKEHPVVSGVATYEAGRRALTGHF